MMSYKYTIVVVLASKELLCTNQAHLLPFSNLCRCERQPGEMQRIGKENEPSVLFLRHQFWSSLKCGMRNQFHISLICLPGEATHINFVVSWKM